ncbi:hypothetical protein E2C01_053333 [Portunus trituberculatus]|uniref:Uncharacterized protein n=1 Tax=Portunus trituberculatus TaxID=210409 RepID=A0A5B7GQ17_PORTR|nr:hypothetical protein [Portunus trituberculatus]
MGRGLPMLVRSPVKGQAKWFLRRLPVDQRSHPLKGSPNMGRPELDSWVSRLGCFGMGVSALSWTNIRIMWGLFIKRLVHMGTRYPVHGSQRSLLF